MKYWKTNRDEWLRSNPYMGPYPTKEEAEDWASRIRTVHRDAFNVIRTDKGFEVEQDLP